MPLTSPDKSVYFTRKEIRIGSFGNTVVAWRGVYGTNGISHMTSVVVVSSIKKLSEDKYEWGNMYVYMYISVCTVCVYGCPQQLLI